MKKNTRKLLAALVVPAALTLGGTAMAAGPLAVCGSGQAFLWPAGGANIPFNPDQGDLGPLTNPQAVAQVQASFDAWAAVPTATVTYTNAGQLPVDVDITNFLPFLEPVAPDGLSAIVFDHTGEIFDLIFGPGSGVLGFAGPEWGDTSTCEILEGVSFLNGPSFTDITAATDVMVHEFGHYTNLAHTVVNGQQFIGFGDTTGPQPDNPFIPPDPFANDYIETMYPFYFGPGIGTQTLERDDISSVSALYPDASFATTTANISGTIFSSSGTTRLTGVNVIARNEANPFEDAVSAISSDYSLDFSQADPFTGVYTLFGLTPGANYRVYVDTILAGGFSTPPLVPLPGVEEYHNGANESNNVDGNDPPLEFVHVQPPATGVDVIFNALVPGDPLPVGDEGFVELALPFEFEVCGETYGSVFVNSNGNLTFGAPDDSFLAFLEDVGAFLAGPPRIAALWDDLNADAGGIVTFQQNDNRFTVIFDSVPEFPAVGANSFSIELRRGSGHVNVTYGDVSAVDGLAGVSCGGAVTSGFEPAVDLSAQGGRINLHKQPAVYELFTAANPVDIANGSVRYSGTTNFEDRWAEPNDVPLEAKRIALPFNSIAVARFTEIEPTGADIDWYVFRARAGESLVLQVISGQLDTLLGLFDLSGTLVAADDDGGNGLLSRIVYEVPATDWYFLAVTTFPDDDFTGDGGSGGRYVLDLSAVEGTVLTLGDDSSVEVPLPFSFPFQGSSYSSVFVNSNGNLTFGAGDPDFSETVAELLSDEPRIAALWHDLSPNVAGLVIVESETDFVTVRFQGVPQFGNTDDNTFGVTLWSNGTIELQYDNVDSVDNIVGVTPGGGATDPGPVDLSSSPVWPATGTTYEQFGTSPNDLEGQTIVFDDP
jgi:hypothetical protein